MASPFVAHIIAWIQTVIFIVMEIMYADCLPTNTHEPTVGSPIFQMPDVHKKVLPIVVREHTLDGYI